MIYVLYSAAEALHVNYYDDVKPLDEIRRILSATEDLLRRIADATQRISADPPAPSYDRRPPSA